MAAHFAQEQASQAEPGANKTAETWLRTRAGRALKKRWEEETAARQLEYMLQNPYDTILLDANPSGVADGRRDRRRYPRMVREDVTTPEILQEASVEAPATTRVPSDDQPRGQIDVFEKYRGEVMRAAFDGEMMALAHAMRANDIDRVVARSAAVVECMGAQIASHIPPDVRGGVVEIIRDVALHLIAARTQLVMHSDEEVDDALDEMQTSVTAANAALSNYLRDTLQVSPAFKAMYDNREIYTTSNTNCLQEFYWLGNAPRGQILQAGSGSQPVTPAPSVVQSVDSGINDGRESTSVYEKSPSTNSRKRPRSLHENQQTNTEKTNSKRGKEQSVESGASGEDNAYEPSSSEDSRLDAVSNFGREIPNRFFRKRVPKDDALLVWTDLEDQEHPRTVHVYPVDLDSLQAGALLTQTTLDYFIYRYMDRAEGLVRVYGSEVYVLMETAKFTRKPGRKHRLFTELSGLLNWASYQYVFLPVSGRNHWSFLIIENPMHHERTKVYHINSMKNAHSSAYAFDVLGWFLKEMHKTRSGTPSPFENGVLSSISQSPSNRTAAIADFTHSTTWM